MASLERPDGEQRPALVHDLSESGALVLLRSTKVSVDDEVAIHLLVGEDSQESRPVRGKIVRVEALSPRDGGPWLSRVAMRFHEPLQMNAAEIERFRRRAERLGIAMSYGASGSGSSPVPRT